MKNKTAINAFFFVLTLALLIINLPRITFHSSESIINWQAKTLSVVCAADADQEACYSEKFSAIAAKYPLEHTLQVIDRLSMIDVRAAGCHFIGHAVGEEEIKKKPDDWENIIAKLPVNKCTGGFLMGALEAHKVLDVEFRLNAKTIPEICNNVLNATKQPGSDQTCVHTSGHLLLIEQTGIVTKAIDECGGLPSFFIYECSSGVFMENIYRRNLHEHGIGLPLEWNEKTLGEQQRFCLEFSGEHSQACWREISHMFVSLTDRNPQKIQRLCNKAPEQLAKDSCYLHAVSVLLMTAKAGEEEIRDLCSPFAGKREMERCLSLEKYKLKEEI